jgi:opacity protein-like surface antigen
MKKLILALVFVIGVSAISQAQYKPEAGDKNLEINFAPLGGTPVSIPGIKFRSFMSATSAFRLGVFVGYNNTTTITQEEDFDVDNNNEQLDLELRDKKSTFSFAIQPGIEKHFAGTDRLSPYIGGFVNLGYTSKTDYSESQTVTGPITDTDLFLADTKTSTGQLNLGLNAVAGFDYYFAAKLYIGAEIGFGFAMNNDFKSKVTENTTELNDANDAFIQVTNTGESILNNKSTFQVGPNVVGQIRVGWLF